MSSVDVAAWEPFVARLCEALGVAPGVDVAALLDPSREVARRVERPMAPVSAYLAGRAVAGGLPFEDAVAAVLAITGTGPADG